MSQRERQQRRQPGSQKRYGKTVKERLPLEGTFQQQKKRLQADLAVRKERAFQHEAERIQEKRREKKQQKPEKGGG